MEVKLNKIETILYCSIIAQILVGYYIQDVLFLRFGRDSAVIFNDIANMFIPLTFSIIGWIRFRAMNKRFLKILCQAIFLIYLFNILALSFNLNTIEIHFVAYGMVLYFISIVIVVYNKINNVKEN